MARARAVWALTLSVVLSLVVLTPLSAAAPTAAAPTAPHATTAPTAAGLVTPGLVTPGPEPAVILTRVDPVVVAPGEALTVSGLLDVDVLGLDLSAAAPTAPTTSPPAESPPVVSPSADPVATVEVRLGARTPATREDVDDWVSGSEPSRGRVLAADDVVTAPDATVDRIPFTVVVEGLREVMRSAYGVIPLSVEVRTPDAAEPAAVLRTFVGYQVRKEYEPLGLTFVVPFTVPADIALLSETGPERADAWAALLGDDGTLRERLASAADPDILWALDPALLGPGPLPEQEEAGQPEPEQPGGDGDTGDDGATGDTEGPQPATPTTPASPGADGDPPTEQTGEPSGTPGDATSGPEDTEPPAAETSAATERRMRTEFAELLLEAVRGRDVLLLPTHDADVAALPPPGSEGPTPDAVRGLIGRSLDIGSATTMLDEAGATVVPTVWPAEGSWSSALDASLRELTAADGPRWSVLSSSASLAAGVRGPMTTGTGALVLPYDELLSARASAVDGRAQVLPSALAIMADSLIVLNERPGTVRHIVVVLDRESPAAAVSADLTSVLEEVPWLETPGLGEPVDEGELVAEAPATASPPVLVDEAARGLAETAALLPVAASVRSDTGVELATRGADTLAQLTSVRWRGRTEDWTTAYEPIAAQVAETFTGLSIPSRNISFLADSGLLRVTVENTLDTGVENATLDLTVAHPILRIESGPQPVEVSAQSRSTVGFEASAIASGRVSVTATLRAADGTVLGEPTEFSVRVSPTSDWIYWVLGGLAGIVIAVGVARMAWRSRSSG